MSSCNKSCIDICVEFEEDDDFNAVFSDMDLEVPVKFDDVIEVDRGIKEHPLLAQRDLPNQHPIGAITSLNGELSARPSEVLTNADILSILSR